MIEQDCPLSEFSARRAAERYCEEILCAGVSILFRLEECRTETGGGFAGRRGGRDPDKLFLKKIIEKFCGKKRAVTGGYRPTAVVARLDWVSPKRAFNAVVQLRRVNEANEGTGAQRRRQTGTTC